MRERSQEVILTNPTSQRVEVSTDLGFKLIQSDSLGRITLSEEAQPEGAARSCKGWLKIFPRKFTLAPGESRSARVLILPPDSIPDGEYWGRAIFSSLPADDNPAGDLDSGNIIRTKLRMQITLDIPVIFRKGTMQTGIAVEGVALKDIGEGTLALIDVKRLGNCAYRGTLAAVLRGADGSVIKRVEDQFTTEFALREALRFPKLAPGSYSLDVEAVSTKKGGANDAVISAPTVKKTYDISSSAAGWRVDARE